MSNRPLNWIACSLLALAPLACTDDAAGDTGDGTETDTDETTDDGTETETDTGGDEDVAFVNHAFPSQDLDPFEEIQPCAQWTLENEQAIYVQGVTVSNLGYFHHSNWFVVPDSLYPGEDGFFDCSERGFTELAAAASGTVLFAQSTQSFVEEQRTGDGAVIKVPPNHKVIAATHMLNVGPAPVATDLFVSLEIIHPKLVDIVLTPFRLSYGDLDIPANAESRFTGIADELATRYEDASAGPMDMKLHYVLPHFHYLGNYFDLTLTGGSMDGQSVYNLNGFNGEANGLVFDPPLDLSDVKGLRYTCGYDNWRDVNVGWGIGDQEMCVMLGLAESKVLIDISMTGGTEAVGMEDDIFMFEGQSAILIVAKNAAQTPPTDAERDGEFYVPPSGDDSVPAVPECVDHDANVAPTIEPTLSNVAAVVFQQSCTFNACHGSSAQAAGLDLMAPNLHAELLDHEVMGNAAATLVEPGDPESSWLYEIIASCEPDGGSGNHMPLNAPVLLDDTSIALVREWIAAGALDD